MRQPLTLIGERQVCDTARGKFPAEIIVGVQVPGEQPVMMRTGDPRYPTPHQKEPRHSVIALGAKAVDRTVEVFTRLFVEGEPVDYDCTGFPLYVFGEIPQLKRGDFTKTHRAEFPALPNGLEPGRAYAIQNTMGDIVHSMIATDPNRSLGLMGRSIDGGGLMMRTANPHLMTIYNGVSVLEITRNGERLGGE